MADPVTAAAALAAGATLVKGVGDFSSGMYQSKVAEMNSKVAQDNARRALQRSDVEAVENDRLTAEMLGEQEAAQGASGLSLTGKSFAANRARTRILGRRDTLNIRQAGQIENYNYKVQRQNFRAESKSAKTSAYLGLAGSVLEAGSIVGNAKATSAARKY
jgi:hypothetical protein